MAALTRVQEDFQAFLLRSDSGIEAHVVGTERVPIATRLAIYSDAYRLRLIEALESNYPALVKLLGPTDFATLGAAYVRTHDSRFRSIRYYGEELAAFLATESEYAQAPVLAELSRWEWAMTEAFDAADTASVDVNALAPLAPERWVGLRFEFHPSLRRLELLWNAPQIWQALANNVGWAESAKPNVLLAPGMLGFADSAQPTPIGPRPSVLAEPLSWALWRQNFQTFFRSLRRPEAEALDAARHGASFGDICAGLVAHFSEEEIPGRAASYLRQWIEAGLIVEVMS